MSRKTSSQIQTTNIRTALSRNYNEINNQNPDKVVKTQGVEDFQAKDSYTQIMDLTYNEK